MEIFKAHTQWATRPADERFGSIQELYNATKAYADTAVERDNVPTASLRVENVDGAVMLVGKGNTPAALTHWAFGQLAARVEVPASYVRTLPATLACQNLNHGLAKRISENGQDTVSMLLHQNGSLLVRALTSEGYERIWNWEVAQRLLRLEAQGWAPATPDVRKIDERLPLYASDHDLFAFVAHNERTISEPGNPDGLKRGVIVENSEVGASALKLTRFLYREMCGNNIIWGASKVTELRARHTKNVRDKMRQWDVEVRRYLDQSSSLEEAAIAQAKSRRIAGTKDELLDRLFGMRSLNLSRKAIEGGYGAVNEAQDGDPLTVWGMVQGLTRYSQDTKYADERTTVDRAAGRLMEAREAF